MNAFTARLVPFRGVGTALAAVGLALGVTASPLAAQLAANPVYFSPKSGTGLMLAADFGTTLDAKVGGFDTGSNPNHVGVRASLGLPIINFGVGVGVFDPDVTGADKDVQFSAHVALKLFSPPLLPVGVSLQAGAGYLKQGSGVLEVTTMSVPIGIGIAVKPPTPGVSLEAWGAPRVHLRSTSVGDNSAMQAGVGASAGVNLGMPMGLGVHVAADWARHSRKTSGPLNLSESEVLVFGVGLHYTFTIPGLPIVPVI